MFEHQKIKKLDDFFTDMSKRAGRGVYFYRINAYTEGIGNFIKVYYEAARQTGVVIEGKIQNPDEKNLSYYEEIMGLEFQMSREFVFESLKKWLPRMNERQRRNVAESLCHSLETLQKAGKNENILKNAYIKFMCWLYYKFERIVNLLGEETVPKILYEGEISSYELLLLSSLSLAGCDVVLLQYRGDQSYLKLDPSSALSDKLQVANMKEFPAFFNLKWIREQIQMDLNNQRLYGKKPELINCTNVWIKGKALEDIRHSPAARGEDPKLFYNCFCRITGVEDKLTYINELYQFQQELKGSQRRLVIVNKEIPPPTNEEIAAVHRKPYSRQDQMLSDLIGNIQYTGNAELQRLMVKAFLDLMLEEAKLPEMSLNKLTNKAVYLICWLKRYQQELFGHWKPPETGCFIRMGGCKNENEALFLRMLARLPVDVLILNPDWNQTCCLIDPLLYERKFPDSMKVERFPSENTDIRMGTAAYHAERELDSLMYRDSGIYRNQQYQKANAVNLQTMYEEIRILWDQETRYRPNFSTTDELVNVPVICAKVSGVKEGPVLEYWRSIKRLLNKDTFLIREIPFIEPASPNPMKAYATEFYKNGRFQRNRIKGHPKYPYGFLREEIQEHILDKLQILIEEKLIKGTFENGTEYTIIATVLNLPKELLRMIQKFDFTKKNPKLICINTTEKMFSLEDAILVAFLNLVGFDMVFFVPTGYQNIERYYQKRFIEEHQIGEYQYDLTVPDLDQIPMETRPKSWREKIFKRGV